MVDYNKEKVFSSIVGLNPTGTMTLEGTYKMNGSNNIVKNSNSISKDNLTKVNNNEIVCGSIENFENYSNINYKKNYLLILILLIILIIIYFI